MAKKKNIVLAAVGLVLSAIVLVPMTACGSIDAILEPTQSPQPSAESVSATYTPIPTESIAPAEESQVKESVEAKKSGNYTLPCGMNILFSDYVRNDVTGNWRRASTSDSYIPADYALEYYNEMFSSDDEIHSIWNATLGTNTRISAAYGILYVDTFEYVSGEEHDAKLMFSGMKLDSKMIDIETGEEITE